MNGRTRRALVALLCGGIMLAVEGCADEAQPDAEPKALPAVTAPDLAKAFAQNSIAAKADYGAGAVITGTVEQVSEGSDGKPVVMVEPSVGVLLEADQREAAARLSAGQKVTARCAQVRTLLGVLIAKGCRLDA